MQSQHEQEQDHDQAQEQGFEQEDHSTRSGAQVHEDHQVHVVIALLVHVVMAMMEAQNEHAALLLSPSKGV